MAIRCQSCDASLGSDEVRDGVCPLCDGPVELGLRDGEILCPCCQRGSDSIKYYGMGVLLFILAGWIIWPKDEIGCPACIRGKIARFLLVNFLTANVLWPFIIMPWGLIMLMRSLTKGHSSALTSPSR